MESLSRNGGSIGSDKSKIMGIKGRRNLLLGLNGDEDNGSPSSPSTSRDTQINDLKSTRDTSYRRPVLDESSDDEGEDEEGSGSGSGSGASDQTARPSRPVMGARVSPPPPGYAPLDPDVYSGGLPNDLPQELINQAIAAMSDDP